MASACAYAVKSAPPFLSHDLIILFRIRVGIGIEAIGVIEQADHRHMYLKEEEKV